MSPTRRQFLHASLAAGAVSSLGLHACASAARASTPEKQRILILGGTGFLGPALIDAVLARGHELTLFNSGTTEARREQAGRDTVVPEGVEVLIGNRDPEQTADDRRYRDEPEKRDPESPRGLTQLEGKTWDAAIDTSGYFPRMVRASAELLAPNVEQYVFVSSISVYAHNDEPGMDETAELLTLDDPTVEDFGENFVNYGGGKALCEAAAEAALPGRTTNVRPGYIVGRRDTSRRFLWWPWRAAQGGEMLVPGTPDDPVQIIDVRDLAEWVVRCIETRTVGAFNATGPAKELTMRAMLEGCREAAGTETKPVWADPGFLAEHGLGFPIWVAPEGETAGFHRVSVAKAVQAGLRFRPVEDTAADALAWHASLPPELQARVLPPITLEREAEVLELWKQA
jgi:2'-hydroxyisoflavone reductase